MTNPFSGIINDQLKTLHTNMISSLLYNDALTWECRLYYGITKYEDCTNCIYDAVGRKSANKYQDGGAIPFPFGSICPMCNGNGKRGVESYEDMSLMIIWDSKQFINTGTVNDDSSDLIQTVTFSTNLSKLVKAKEIIVVKDKASHGTRRYERASTPQPCGFGTSDFISCLWKRSG